MSHRLFRRTTALALSLGITLLSSLGAQRAAAQTRVRGSDFRTREVVDESLLQQGRFSLFLSATGGWSYGSTSTDGGDGQSQNTVFSLPSIGAGYMVTDALQLRLCVNGILVFAGIDGAESQETYGVGATVQALYHFEIAHGMAFYVGAGVGGFYSTRTVPAAGVLEARLSGGGFQGQVPFGLLVQPGSALFLRGGIRVDVLAGSESPTQEGSGALAASFVNVFANAELSVGIRF